MMNRFQTLSHVGFNGFNCLRPYSTAPMERAVTRSRLVARIQAAWARVRPLFRACVVFTVGPDGRFHVHHHSTIDSPIDSPIDSRNEGPNADASQSMGESAGIIRQVHAMTPP